MSSLMQGSTRMWGLAVSRHGRSAIAPLASSLSPMGRSQVCAAATSSFVNDFFATLQRRSDSVSHHRGLSPVGVRCLSSNRRDTKENDNEGNNMKRTEGGSPASTKFSPRRRSSPSYRPAGEENGAHRLWKKKKKNELAVARSTIDPQSVPRFPKASDVRRIEEWDEDEGGELTAMRRRTKDETASVETYLRAVDYLTADEGSTGDLVGERRNLAMDIPDIEERQDFLHNLDQAIEEEGIAAWELSDEEEDLPMEEEEPLSYTEQVLQKKKEEEDEKDPNRMVDTEDWTDYIVRTDRVVKVIPGGVIARYRSLVVGGNGNGVAGFGIAKCSEANDSILKAMRACRRNIFFVDRFRGCALTGDLAGRHNSCRVSLRAVGRGYGLKGNELVCDILHLFGITDCTAKTHGNRNDYNVVRATFKALLTHESMEDIAMKRGRRLLALEKANQLDMS